MTTIYFRPRLTLFGHLWRIVAITSVAIAFALAMNVAGGRLLGYDAVLDWRTLVVGMATAIPGSYIVSELYLTLRG
jgi:hypothetical protein